MQSRAQHAAPKTAPAVCAKTRRDLPDAGQLPALWGRRLCVLRRRLVARRAGRAHRAVRVRARRRHPPAPALRDAHGQHPRAPRRDRPRDAAALLRRKDARRRESARRGRRRHGLRDGRVLPAGHVPGARRDGGAVPPRRAERNLSVGAAFDVSFKRAHSNAANVRRNGARTAEIGSARPQGTATTSSRRSRR